MFRDISIQIEEMPFISNRYASLSFQLIFKCPMCDTVFHKYQQLQDHLVQHYPDTKKVHTWFLPSTLMSSFEFW